MTDQLSSPSASASLAFHNLTETCRSPATRRVYTMALRFFMDYLHLPSDAYDKLLEKEPKLIQMDICDFTTHLRKAGHSPASVSTYLAAIRKFYDMNDIDLHRWLHRNHRPANHRSQEQIRIRKQTTKARNHTL